MLQARAVVMEVRGFKKMIWAGAGLVLELKIKKVVP